METVSYTHLDNAPVEIVKGAVEAVKEEAGLLVKLVGREEQVRAELAKYTYPQGQIEVVDAPDVIETGEQPVMAIRRKKDSSMVRALTMVKEKKADAFVSAGKMCIRDRAYIDCGRHGVIQASAVGVPALKNPALHYPIL